MKETSATPRTALVVADMMFAARIRNALEQLAWKPELAGTAQVALKNLSESQPTLVIVELGAGNPERVGLIRSIREMKTGNSLPLLAFGSHKARQSLTDAREAGASLVVSNGTLVARFPQMIEKALERSLSFEDRLQVDEDDESSGTG